MEAEPHRFHCTLATDATGAVEHCCYISWELQKRWNKLAIDPWLQVEVCERRPARAYFSMSSAARNSKRQTKPQVVNRADNAAQLPEDLVVEAREAFSIAVDCHQVMMMLRHRLRCGNRRV